MKKLLFMANLMIGALMAKAADYRHSVTLNGDHLTNITAVVKTSPATVMISCDADLGDGHPAKSDVMAEIKELPEPFLSAWNISTTETPPAEKVEAAAVGSDFNFGQNHTITLPNAVTLDLIWIAPGTFTMGSPLSEGGGYGQQPAHTVTISNGFWLGKTPVTQGQYQALMGNNPSHFVNAGTEAPVEGVSWGEAMAFCRKLTERERAAGHVLEGYGFTLPTEAQWEYACRAGTTGAPYGDVDDIAWYAGNSGESTQPVAQKQPNPWGLYDMYGDVSQWCSDWYGDYPSGKVTDPVGPSSGEYRDFRGSSWNEPAASCRAANRSYNLPGSRFSFNGFRLAVSSVALNKEALASSKPAGVGLSRLRVSSVAQPAGASADARVDCTSLLDLVRQAQQTTDFAQQKSLLKQFMAERSSFLGAQPDQIKLWEVHAASALGLDDVAAGFEVGQKLLAAGAADSNDQDLQQLMAQLKNNGWLDEQTAKRAIAARTKALNFTEGQNHTVTLPKAVTLDLIWIAPGTFMMGSPVSEPDRNKDEGPQTEVSISRGFWLGKAPVTQGQFQAIMGHNPSVYSNNPIDTAVETVSWKDAMAFCQKLTERERAAGHLLSGYAYTLPTEAQWEYACRAGTTEARYGNLDDIAWYENNSFNNPHPVAQKKPNAWGLYDMLGNVCQWCSDGYHSTYHGGKVTDPAGVASGNITSSRVFRGGRFNLPASYCRAAIRWNAPSSYSNWSLGFRFALSPVLLDQTVALAQPPGITAPGVIRPAGSVAQPVVTAPSSQLTGMDKIDYNALLLRAREAGQTKDPDQQRMLLKQFMDESRAFLQKHPKQTLIWQLRAASALSFDDIAAGYEAGQKLLAAGAADSNDQDLRPLMAQLKDKGWLDEQTVKATIAARIEALDCTAGKNHTVPLPNDVTLDLVWIAPGTFTMGSPNYGGECPQTEVTISRGFWLGKTLVTQRQYQAVMGDNPSSFANLGPDAPVETVSWKEAMALCQKLTERDRASGHLLKGYAYTLPTEAQWEYACRAGTTGDRYGDLDDIAWYCNNSGNTTHPVAQKRPNAWGLYDMLGNVSEWCLGWGGSYMGGKETDPVGESSSSVSRGGSWGHAPDALRSSSRIACSRDERSYFIGFRLALASVPSDRATAVATPADIAATAEDVDRIIKIPFQQPPWNDGNHNMGSLGGLASGTPTEPGDYVWIEKDRVPVFEQVVPRYSHPISFAERGHCLRILETRSDGYGRWFKVTGDYGLESKGWPTGAYGQQGWIHESGISAVFTIGPHQYKLRFKIGIGLMIIIVILIRLFFWRALVRR